MSGFQKCAYLDALGDIMPSVKTPVPVSEAVKTIPEGVDPDAWYDQVYSYQIKPCAFRRWFSDVLKNGATTECEKELVDQIKSLQADGVGVEDAFKEVQDVYVSRADYSNEYFKQLREKNAKKASVPFVEENPTPVGV